MSHRPKLEIYKLNLKKKEDGGAETFRNLFRNKLDYKTLTPPYTTADIFKIYHKNFVSKISTDSYTANKAKKKGFTIATDIENGKPKSKVCSPIGSTMILDGLLEGGKYGLRRSLGVIGDTSSKSPIKTENLVNDRYYFLIYTPLDSSYGFLFVQSYSEVKISDVFRKHIERYFSYGKEIKCEIEIFVPKKLKEEYLDGAIFKRVQFTTDWQVEPTFQGKIKGKDFELEVKIEIADKSAKKSDSKQWNQILESLGSGLFSFGKKERQLKNFRKSHVRIENWGNEHPIVLDTMEVQPVVYLDSQGVKIFEDGVPDFERIEKYCHELLKNVIKEIDPNNAIEDL